MSDLISKLNSYVSGTISHADFSEWFYPFSRTAEQRFAVADLEFIDSIQGTLAETSSGRWTDAQLLQDLKLALTEFDASANTLTFQGELHPR